MERGFSKVLAERWIQARKVLEAEADSPTGRAMIQADGRDPEREIAAIQEGASFYASEDDFTREHRFADAVGYVIEAVALDPSLLGEIVSCAAERYIEGGKK